VAEKMMVIEGEVERGGRGPLRGPRGQAGRRRFLGGGGGPAGLLAEGFAPLEEDEGWRVWLGPANLGRLRITVERVGALPTEPSCPCGRRRLREGPGWPLGGG
jgi:hypothetical protein